MIDYLGPLIYYTIYRKFKKIIGENIKILIKI